MHGSISFLGRLCQKAIEVADHCVIIDVSSIVTLTVVVVLHKKFRKKLISLSYVV